ncbi:phage shock protein operon transcriptional activator [Pseudohalioglobus sediminis]|uniref:Phage shock protein operon transcriptional activator n=1 Tax=Pseudohalioglobus sediminis TaxID=2606449 RepID=A0A5B0WM90_9GAMM|nr:phage shock protein operon transcriptional activator [Pseudohalioglobus sediminis]KAA1188200.1 phage shock protein operon transcriptional activator [Pseudohalioglobus sediminis]
MRRNQESIIGNSAALAHALEQVSRLAPVDRPVLIMGERGTGKELIANRLHFLSQRWQAPLLKTNCAAIAESLLESELFGYEPGAFTGATQVRQGRFERADGGTLFLDELGTMSMRLQEKLLRLVEYGEFERLGGQKTLQVDVRVVAATNADLPSLADAGTFRADLLDRLSFDVVHIPPLRHRREDIAELADHFAVQMSVELGWEVFPGFTADALATLQQHDWPGNIRELKNVVERSLHRWGDSSMPVGEIIVDPFSKPWQDRPVKEQPRDPAAGKAEPSPPLSDFGAHMDALEKQLLQDALARHNFHQRRTADTLGLSYDQMRGLVRKHKLSRRQRRS